MLFKLSFDIALHSADIHAQGHLNISTGGAGDITSNTK